MAHDGSRLAAIKSNTALHEILLPYRDKIVECWIGVVHGTYPFDTVGFLHTKANQFANPVGYRTKETAEVLVDMVFTTHPDIEKIDKAVDEIIQVRAIQEFSPETAVGIFFALKEIIRDLLEKSDRMDECYLALLSLESRIDAVSLMAFGAYARYRERLHLIRVGEMRRDTSQIRRLVNIKSGDSSVE